MTFWSSIVEKIGTLPDETIYIMFECIVYLHGHRNKLVDFMKSSILVDLSNGAKFHSYTYWLSNNPWSHQLLCWVSNHHIDNEDLVLSGHVKINL